MMLIVLPAGAVSQAPEGALADVLSVLQSSNVTAQGKLTVSLKLSDPSNVSIMFFTFCQLPPGSLCYTPVVMASQGTGWFVGTTPPMTAYPKMTVGVKAGYNISIDYKSGVNLTEPTVPNPFGNLTVAPTVTGELVFEMSVVDVPHELSGAVRDAATGRGLAGATVSVSPGNTPATTTSSTGAYFFSGLLDGNYSLSVSANGYQTGSATVSISGRNVTQNITMSNNTTPVNPHGTGTGGAQGWSSYRIAGVSPFVIVPVVIVLVALALSLWLRNSRRPPKTPSNGPSATAPPPQNPE
jgi:carboxypeptidase family protein